MKLFVPFLILALIILNSCTRKPEPYSLLEFTGKGGIYNYSRSIYPTLFVTDSVRSTALLAGDGDLIAYGENCCFFYKVPSRNKFSIKNQDSKGFINDKINSISIPANESLIPWFEQMKSADIAELGFLYFDSIISESYVPYLTELAKTKPHIGLGYDGALKDMTRLFEIFKPELIIGATVSQEDFNLLPGLTSLQFLFATLDDSAYLIPLPAMPELKQFVLTYSEEGAIKTDDFLINNKQIERLTIIGSGKFDLSLIKPLENLKQLVISGTDTILNYDLILDQKQLDLLSVDGKNACIEPTLKKLSGIRWMTFYEEETQSGFNSFIEFHPDLEVVEIINNATIKNLQPLLKLNKLYGLAISDTLTDLIAIKSMKNLKYLSIPYELLDDRILKADLQNSLPGTVIVPNQGICLGSGWLLLIIPIIAVLRIFTRKKSRRAQTGF
jgi:hypothetical protein